MVQIGKSKPKEKGIVFEFVLVGAGFRQASQACVSERETY